MLADCAQYGAQWGILEASGRYRLVPAQAARGSGDGAVSRDRYR